MTGRTKQLRIEFGRRWLTPAELSDLECGQVMELDAQVDDLVDVYVNGHLRGRGEAVVVDGKLGVRISEVIRGG
ncbi:MAG: Flagellar motor switch protein FliN [Planctomycetes bacterium ADurb.Bin126]|nr:MAG: Flagellar motor switch protein FliN [Planctomycetes bacterium ADurb.Bin126]HOD82597.1 FliM/FliN family flagellar motor C-terminal domain-containing protein [Phycisphaerae bacterium]HQL75020.1 FliM/FliN family flagellar motor C-terminal domain-containing protein [Phycisphaerae bacterium]